MLEKSRKDSEQLDIKVYETKNRFFIFCGQMRHKKQGTVAMRVKIIQKPETGKILCLHISNPIFFQMTEVLLFTKQFSEKLKVQLAMSPRSLRACSEKSLKKLHWFRGPSSDGEFFSSFKHRGT